VSVGVAVGRSVSGDGTAVSVGGIAVGSAVGVHVQHGIGV
jgi:hypothetical protein